MIESGITESVIEQAALAWLECLGYAVKHDPGHRVGYLYLRICQNDT